LTALNLRRASLLLVAAIAVLAMFAGLARLGIPVSFAGARAQSHGPLFVLGVFFPLIALERAVAFGKRTGYVAPLLAFVGGLGIVAGVQSVRAVSAVAAGALLVLNGALWRKQPSAHLLLMLVGSASLLVGAVAFAADFAVSDVVLCWVAFFVLTIVAERIELARFVAPPRRAVQAILGFGFSIGGLTLLGVLGNAWCCRACGGLLGLIGAWLLRYDLARRTLRQPGLPRFAAVAVLLGAVWLSCSGLLLFSYGLPPGGPIYDAVLHGVFIGFVVSMVFGHAPIILPAVAHTPVPYHAALYAPLLALHCGLLARWGGDLLGLPLLRQAGGGANALALAAFPVAIIWARRGEPASNDSNHPLRAE
jgi:hypothetical protein